jgi:hypothetical protein
MVPKKLSECQKKVKNGRKCERHEAIKKKRAGIKKNQIRMIKKKE